MNAAFDAATSNPELLPIDFFLAVMRDPSIPADWRFRAAHAAAPYVHRKAERAQAVDPPATAKHIEGPKDPSEDPLYQALQAWKRAKDEEHEKWAAQRVKTLTPEQKEILRRLK